jgi:hypothetical protein
MRKEAGAIAWAVMVALASWGCSERARVRAAIISVGDPAAEVWKKLGENGHSVARIPLDGRQQVPTADGGSRVVAVEVPYEVNGRVVLFTHDLARNVITSISIAGVESVRSIDVTKVQR